MSRPQRPRRGRARRVPKPRGASAVGRRFEVDVGPVAHGGHCVARVGAPTEEDPARERVVFVRHAIPGERVVVEVTEGTEGDRFWRGDAVHVLRPSPDRVAPPCPFSGPDACGGCDFQHVELGAQRRLKAAVIEEQLRRLAGLDVAVTVEAVPNPALDPALADRGLGWRTRQRYAVLPDGGRAMRKHRSHDLVPVDECLIEAPVGPSYDVRGRSFEVADGGFWQVHPGAPETLVDAVLEALEPRPGESALDLYAGVGLFSRFLLEAVGPDGRVAAVEGDAAASELSLRNCPGLHATSGDVAGVLAAGRDGGLGPEWDSVDLVVLDPPRTGAKRAAVEQVVARSPRAVGYVACDPAALARDVGIFAEHGYRLAGLRAFDLFPMTHHVECVALLVPDAGQRTTS
ncbi:class I SAM-dependent RNA methyltransferase [Nocardioides sp. SYSU DS0651]|uniref:class I SAM-dependent RNA methyltransferase n=1 Tax=Nocardioides sp. SYSU DS0651 TaxID=3415955 RepID=UPI003F4B7F88